MFRFHTGRVRVLGLSALLCAVALPASAPAATTSKPYTLNISPASVPAGKATTVFATYKNTTGTQQLGSSNLTAPAGYTVTSASLPSGTQLTISGSTIKLRNLALAPGNSVTVTIGIVPPCTSGTAAWSVITKQSNDFNGPPGNDLTLDTRNSSITTTTAGSCQLRFFTQPANARVNQIITDTAYTPPPGGGPVKVEYVDGAGNRLDKSDSITMSTSPATTLDGTKTVSMANGVASFGDLSILAAGDYRLVATGSGGNSTQSNQFHVDGYGQNCTEDNGGCEGTITNAAGNQTVKTEALPDPNATDVTRLTMAFTPEHPIDCPGYTERAPDTAVVDAPGRIKLVTVTLAASLVAGVSPLNPLQSCIEAPYQFTPRLGTTLTPVDENGDGVFDHWLGLLPDCFEVTTGILYPPPCVEARGSHTNGDQWIQSKLPAPDPWIR